MKIIDIKRILNCCKESKYIVPIILIFIAMCFSIHYRMYPSNLNMLPKIVEEGFKEDFMQKGFPLVQEMYPHLSQSDIISALEEEWDKSFEEGAYDQIIEKEVLRAKDMFQDEHGYTYLIGADPYLWYAQAKHILGIGDYTVAELREGRIDKPYSLNLHPYFTVALYKFLHFFNKNITLMRALFLMPVILIALSLIPAFFITKRIAGNFGGFFAMMLISLNQGMLARTIAGFSDTDPYNVLIPLYTIWFLIIAWHSKDLKKTILFSSFVGILLGLYSALWAGGWVHLFLLISIALFLYVPIRFIQKKKFKRTVYLIIPFLISSAVFVSLFRSFKEFYMFFFNIINFVFIKQVGVKTIWPNVMTTVHELQAYSFIKIFSIFGKMFFLLMVAGLVILVFKKKYKHALLLSFWFVGTAYSFTKGIRFTLLAIPSFAILVGIGVGYIYNFLSDFSKKHLNISKCTSKPVFIILFLLLFLNPISSAKELIKLEVPNFNDAWYNTLRAIHDDCEDGIITSWWDFGHWFYSISERRVTFDGGKQGKNIYWVGRTLLTSNETEAVNILRMLNCGQNNYYEELVEQGMSEKEAIDTIHQRLSEGYDFCGQSNTEPLLQYFIASEDMVGKAIAWAHFGSWDFDRAQLWNDIKTGKEVDIDEDLKYNIMNTKADEWIAGRPLYGDMLLCSYINDTLVYGELTINLTEMEPYFEDGSRPNNFVYADNGTFYMKEYETSRSIGIGLLKNNYILTMDPKLSGSMFTRLFFYNATGLEHFESFHHDESVYYDNIHVYKVRFK